MTSDFVIPVFYNKYLEAGYPHLTCECAFRAFSGPMLVSRLVAKRSPPICVTKIIVYIGDTKIFFGQRFLIVRYSSVRQPVPRFSVGAAPCGRPPTTAHGVCCTT